VQVDVIRERAERLELASLGEANFDPRADLDLRDRNPGRSEARERSQRIFELDRHVARIEAHAEVPPEGRLGLGPRGAGERAEKCRGMGRVEVPLEEIDGLGHRLDVAARLGLEREGDGLAGPGAQAMETPRPRERCDRPSTARRCRWARESRNAPGTVLTLPIATSSGRSFAQDLAERDAVGDPCVVQPIGQVHRLLHARRVKSAVRKAVDREDR